jgi:hypothetical protein
MQVKMFRDYAKFCKTKSVQLTSEQAAVIEVALDENNATVKGEKGQNVISKSHHHTTN